MEQKWTKVLMLLVLCQRKFAWTLRSGPFVALGAVENSSRSFQKQPPEAVRRQKL